MLTKLRQAEADTIQDGPEGPFSLWPEAMGPFVAARIGHRLAMHIPVSYARIKSERPLVSFTFDDVPKSAAVAGAEILGEHGVHGTFYVSGDLTGSICRDWEHASADELLTLHRGGHELGCHTFAHKKVFEFDRSTLPAEIERNLAYFRALDPTIKLGNFAYPWGLGSFPLKQPLAQYFRSCRSVMPGVNHGRVDLQFLRSTHLIDGRIDAAGVDRAMDEAVRTNGWLIFYSHDVANSPSEYGCSPALLRHALASATQRNILVTSVAEALDFVGI